MRSWRPEGTTREHRLTVVGSRHRERPKDGRLDAVQALVDADMGQVNRLIVARLDSPVHLISELARHLVAAAGASVSAPC